MDAAISKETLMASDQQASRLQSERLPSAEEIYQAHHEHIFRLICSRVHYAQQAEDPSGEVFTRMVTNLLGTMTARCRFVPGCTEWLET